jgi:hypothetical protein
MRLLLLYLRSRRVPVALVVAAAGVAALSWIDHLTDHRVATTLALFAVIAGTAAAGPGLAGPDVELDRTAGIGWPPRRAAHLLTVGGAVVGLIAATALTGDQLGPAGQVTRNVAGMVGLLALGAARFGSGRAWIPPLTWTLMAMVGRAQFWPSESAAAYQRMLTWMVQPEGSAPAGWTAVGLAVAGVLTYAVAGPHRTGSTSG